MPPPRLDRDSLPTIEHDRQHGCTGVLVYCAGLYCSHSGRISFATIALPDDTIILDIPRFKRFICTKCGARTVEIRADWPRRAAGAGGAHRH